MSSPLQPSLPPSHHPAHQTQLLVIQFAVVIGLIQLHHSQLLLLTSSCSADATALVTNHATDDFVSLGIRRVYRSQLLLLTASSMW